MKILFVSHVPTDPPTAGNRARIVSLTQLFESWGWDVHFAYLPVDPHDPSGVARRYGSRFHALRFTPQLPSIPMRAWRKLLRYMKRDAGFMWQLDDWFDHDVLPQLARLHAQHRFDAVCAEYVFMSKALEAFPDAVVKLLDTHDCFAWRHRRFLAAGEEPQWFSTTEEQENQGFRRAHAVLAIQPEEAAQFTSRLGASAPCEVLSVGHILEEVPPVELMDVPRAVFLGSENPINVSAVNWFLQQVAPRILRELPDFRLVLAGSVCQGVEVSPCVDRLGFVADLRDVFSRAAVNINPVFLGTGVSIKMLDAMMYGLPCVSSASGARGLERYAGLGLSVVADKDADAFADRLLALLSPGGHRANAAAAARAAALDWNETQQRELHRWLQKVLASASGGSEGSFVYRFGM